MSLKKPSFLAASILSSASILLSACSGSESDNVAITEVSGTVFASNVHGASIIASDANGNTIAGPALSDEAGLFTLKIPNQHLDSNLIITASGGQYQDEATGDTASNTLLSAFIEAGFLGGSESAQFSLTPSSSIIQRLISEHQLSMSEAKSRFQEAFGYIPDVAIIPVDASLESSTADEDTVLAGLRAAIFSQLTADLALPADAQGNLLSLLADDIADGTFDGMEEDLPLNIETGDGGAVSLGLAIQNKFNLAFSNFRKGRDKTGLSDAAVGHLPFAKTASSESYLVTYIPGMMGAMQGKTKFSLRITDHEGNPESGLAPSLNPLMFMADRMHSTPYTDVTEDSEESGLYHASVYYLMASSMANGNSMGYWKLSIELDENSESVDFYPQVMMAMGDTARVNLKSQSDMIPGMMGMDEKRTYILFNNGLAEDENGHNFSVFIASKESMMSFPSIAVGNTLNANSDYQLDLDSISVEMTTIPEDPESWISATTDNSGVWTASGLSNFENTVYVRLSINSEQKTDDGNAPDGEGDEAEFTFSIDGMSNMDEMEHMHASDDSDHMNEMM